MPGNYHISGRCVQYASAFKHRFGMDDESTKRDVKTKSYKMDRKNRLRVMDAAVYQHDVSSKENILSHCFFTLTYPGKQMTQANIDIGRFMDKLSKHCTRIYPEIEDKFSYIWIRELTQKGMDHFHVMAVLPVFKLSEKKHPAIDYSIPFYYPGEQTNRYYSLNKSWCDTIGYYSPNAVRISRQSMPGDLPNKPTGKSLFIIDDLVAAIKYVAKYCTKGQKDYEGNQVTSSKPIMRMSKNLSKWTKPLRYDDVLGFAFDSYYGDSFQFTDKDTGDVKNIKILEGDFAKVGKVQLSKAAKLYFDLQLHEVQQQIKHLENMARMKKLQLKINKIAVQTKIFQ